MAEQHWRLDVAPVRRESRPERSSSRWSATARTSVLAEAPSVQLIPPRTSRRWDAIAALLVAAAVGLSLLKPWGAGRVAVDPVPERPGPAADPAAGLGPIRLPATVFDPRPDECMADIGWHVCVLDESTLSGASSGRAVRNVFGPDVPSVTSPGRMPDQPAVILVTTSGATIAFYAPPGFYAAAQRRADSAGGEPAWGTVGVSAWELQPGSDGTRWIELTAAGPIGEGADLVGNVLVPRNEKLVDALAWPAGRYVVWLKGGGAESWEEFFDFEIAAGSAGATP